MLINYFINENKYANSAQRPHISRERKKNIFPHHTPVRYYCLFMTQFWPKKKTTWPIAQSFGSSENRISKKNSNRHPTTNEMEIRLYTNFFWPNGQMQIDSTTHKRNEIKIYCWIMKMYLERKIIHNANFNLIAFYLPEFVIMFYIFFLSFWVLGMCIYIFIYLCSRLDAVFSEKLAQ